MSANATAPATPQTFAAAEAALASSLPGYTPRPHQQALAARIEEAITDGSILLAEAGTGTGKSLAALIPAILSGRRTVIATATKALQTQYARKDLPFLTEHLGVDFTWAVIKGRSNYPCAQKIHDLDGGSPSTAQAQVMQAVGEAGDGVVDREDLPKVTDTEWAQLSMTSSECPGARDCPFAQQGACHAQRAKDKAAESDIVVTNLAYLAIDTTLGAETGAAVSLLGPYEQLIVDEAHNFDSAITSALSYRLAQGSVMRLAGDAGSYLRDNGDSDHCASALGYAATQLWDLAGDSYTTWQRERKSSRMDAEQMPATERLRLDVLGAEFMAVGEALADLWGAVRRSDAGSPELRRRRDRIARRLGTMTGRIHSFVTDPDEVTVRWVAAEDGRVYLHSVPVSPAPFLREHVWGKTGVILMSATLATGRKSGRADFGYTISLLGLQGQQPQTFESGTPFDYAAQAMLFVPDSGQPVPSGATARQWMAFSQSAMAYLVEASGGGALLLFTSRRAMNDAHSYLATRFEDSGLEVMKQGDDLPGELVRRFREDGNAVLFALRTFFEGVDIPGEALRLVVIDKLPFPVPSDLQFAARCDAVNKHAGRDVSFRQLSMPMMTLPLTQAFGRLLRSAQDRGVVAILDPRLTAKSYGKDILAALPPARRTTDPREAASFLSRR